MIGVVVNSSERAVVEEFFELFKTPWEFYSEGGRYDVVLYAGKLDDLEKISARVVILYSSEECGADKRRNIVVRQHRGGEIAFGDIRIPVYGRVAWLTGSSTAIPTACLVELTDPILVRIGYDLFSEIRTLLSSGQPASNSFVPTVDLHIALLRRLIVGCGLPLTEVPPVPAGFSFIACLTHDLDHPSLRCHKFDATMWGFLYRATIRSVADTARGRLAPKKLLKNFSAAARLPLVYLGLAEDPWFQFQRYVDIEQESKSTFFLIPFANTAGRTAPQRRAAGYDSIEIRDKIRSLVAEGCEVGVHGIDAWTESALGTKEKDRVSTVAGVESAGVRMHWLYFDQGSAAALEEAGFSYDSTVGYNETIGYKAGTTQAFRPFGARELLELPLHIMDTAMFYRAYMNWTESEAWSRVALLVEHASCSGGVLTVNWHDRSLAPERLWEDFYVRLLSELSRKRALFLTGSEAAAWFRARRSVAFEETRDGRLAVRVTRKVSHAHVPLRLRTYSAQQPPSSVVDIERTQEMFVDTSFSDIAYVESAALESKAPASR